MAESDLVECGGSLALSRRKRGSRESFLNDEIDYSRMSDLVSKIAEGLTGRSLLPFVFDPPGSSCDSYHSLFCSRETMLVDGARGK